MSVSCRDIITEAAARANLCPHKKNLPDDMFVAGLQLFNGLLQEFSNKDYITAYQNEVDFNLNSENVIVGEGTDAAVTAPKIQLPKKVLYKYAGQVDWVPMEFIAYENFYSSSYSDYIVSWQPIGPNLYKLYFKSRFVGQNPQIKLIYNVEMTYADNDTVSLPTPYVELLTRALAYKYSVKFPRVDQNKQLSLKAEQDELENSLRATNASMRIITRGGNGYGGSLQGYLRSGGFISDQW